MIPLPTLPTDNLYKFLFVFGIILIVASLYFVNQNIQDDKKELLNFANLANGYKLKAKSINRGLDAIDKSLDSLTNIRNTIIKHDSVLIKQLGGNAIIKHDSVLIKQLGGNKKYSKAELKGIISIEKNSNIKLKEGLKTLDFKKNDLIRLKDKWNKINDTIDYYMNLSDSKERINHIGKDSDSKLLTLVFSIGLMFTVLGGIFWYIKSQYHIDKILAIQATQMEIDLNLKSKSIGRFHFEPRNLPRKQALNKLK